VAEQSRPSLAASGRGGLSALEILAVLGRARLAGRVLGILAVLEMARLVAKARRTLALLGTEKAEVRPGERGESGMAHSQVFAAPRASLRPSFFAK
jgi:hypothetical protein